jgi:small nuclear ribonucleoprotein (snRNP)-like protein
MTEERNMCQGVQMPQTNGQGSMKPTKSKCEKFKYYHVIVTLKDGSSVDGIIIEVKDDGITILISEDVSVDEDGNADEDQRQYGYGGYGRRRARRFRRSFLPLAGLTALALFPYASPYAYYYPTYPYTYPYPYYY